MATTTRDARSRSKKKKKTTDPVRPGLYPITLHVRLGVAMATQVKARAKRLNRSTCDHLRRLVEADLEQEGRTNVASIQSFLSDHDATPKGGV